MLKTSAFQNLGLIFSVFLQIIPDGESSKEANKLLSRLLNDYQILARPVKNESDAVTVRFALSLMKINDLHETEEILKSHLWQSLEWNDPFLTWDPKEFGNITTLQIPPHRIWTPDILLYNSEEFGTTYPTHIVVRNDGNVTYMPPGLHITTCRIGYVNFPFDHQKCFKFGSWTAHGWHVDFRGREDNQTNIDMDISSFTPNQKWNLLRAEGVRDEIRYTCCPEPYVSITFLISLQRRGGQILTQAKGSSIFICLTLFLSFLIPASSAHKITFAILHLVNVWYTLWSLMSKYPNVIERSFDNGGPLFGYFQTMKVLSELALTANIFIFWLYHLEGPIPGWLRKHVIEKISKLSILGVSSSSSPDAVALHGIGTPEDEDDPAGGVEKGRLSDWKYLANILDRCFLVLFTLIALLTWIFLFPPQEAEKKLL